MHQQSRCWPATCSFFASPPRLCWWNPPFWSISNPEVSLVKAPYRCWLDGEIGRWLSQRAWPWLWSVWRASGRPQEIYDFSKTWEFHAEKIGILQWTYEYQQQKWGSHQGDFAKRNGDLPWFTHENAVDVINRGIEQQRIQWRRRGGRNRRTSSLDSKECHRLEFSCISVFPQCVNGTEVQFLPGPLSENC